MYLNVLIFLPQAVCPEFGTFFVPSQAVSLLQSAASPVMALIVFPVHNSQSLPFL